MKFKIIYQDKNLLVLDKPAPLTVLIQENKAKGTLKHLILKKFLYLKNVERNGVVHRLDKETSGIILIAKNQKTFNFLQEKFRKKSVVKKYFALVAGKTKMKQGVIETFINRDPKNRKKQKAFEILSPHALKKGKRRAQTFYKVSGLFSDNDKNFYTLLEVIPKTGRKHQIRVHLSFLGYPIIGDKVYGFKNAKQLNGLKRQFLHANYLKIKIPEIGIKEFRSEMPKDLKNALINLKQEYYEQ